MDQAKAKAKVKKAETKARKAEAKKARAKKDLSKWVKANAKLIKEGEKLAKAIDGELTEIEDELVVIAEPNEDQIVAKVAARDYQGLSLMQIKVGANKLEDNLSKAEPHDKKSYSYFSGLNSALIAALPPINNELRDKELIAELRKYVLDMTPGETDKEKRIALQKRYDWTQFQAGVFELSRQERRIAEKSEDSVPAEG